MKFTSNLDKLGVAGIFLTAISSPCCFPLFGFILSALGLGTFELLGGWTAYIFQTFVLLSLAGTFISYRQHKNMFVLLIAAACAVLIFYAYYFYFDTTLIYTGMAGLLIVAVYNFYAFQKNKKNSLVTDSIELLSTISCPHCGYQKTETMPTNACCYFYECEKCHTRLKPKEGDCCVYCSYGSVKCPPVQQNKSCC